MKTTHRNRTIAAGALAAVLAAGAGVAAVGTGAIALGGGSAGAAIVTPGSGTGSGTRIVTMTADELNKVATKPAYSQQICSDPHLSIVQRSCNTLLPKCAMQWEKSPSTVVAVFDLNTGRVTSCNRAS
jgi:hypothetical protein